MGANVSVPTDYVSEIHRGGDRDLRVRLKRVPGAYASFDDTLRSQGITSVGPVRYTSSVDTQYGGPTGYYDQPRRRVVEPRVTTQHYSAPQGPSLTTETYYSEPVATRTVYRSEPRVYSSVTQVVGPGRQTSTVERSYTSTYRPNNAVVIRDEGDAVIDAYVPTYFHGPVSLSPRPNTAPIRRPATSPHYTAQPSREPSACYEDCFHGRGHLPGYQGHVKGERLLFGDSFSAQTSDARAYDEFVRQRKQQQEWDTRGVQRAGSSSKHIRKQARGKASGAFSPNGGGYHLSKHQVTIRQTDSASYPYRGEAAATSRYY